MQAQQNNPPNGFQAQFSGDLTNNFSFKRQREYEDEFKRLREQYEADAKQHETDAKQRETDAKQRETDAKQLKDAQKALCVSSKVLYMFCDSNELDRLTPEFPQDEREVFLLKATVKLIKLSNLEKEDLIKFLLLGGDGVDPRFLDECPHIRKVGKLWCFNSPYFYSAVLALFRTPNFRLSRRPFSQLLPMALAMTPLEAYYEMPINLEGIPVLPRLTHKNALKSHFTFGLYAVADGNTTVTNEKYCERCDVNSHIDILLTHHHRDSNQQHRIGIEISNDINIDHSARFDRSYREGLDLHESDLLLFSEGSAAAWCAPGVEGPLTFYHVKVNNTGNPLVVYTATNENPDDLRQIFTIQPAKMRRNTLYPCPVAEEFEGFFKGFIPTDAHAEVEPL